MKIKIFLIIIIASYFGTFLRLFFDSNFLTSMIGAFFFGFVTGRRMHESNKEILIKGFCASFTSFSGFIYFVHQLIKQEDFIQLILNLNLIIVLNLIMMQSGFYLSRKIT